MQPPPAPSSALATSDAGASAHDPRVVDSGDGDAPYLNGGTWASCANGFRATSSPERDLIRLGMLCGPYHGMRRVGEAWTGSIGPGTLARSHTVDARKGQCFRVFAVADQHVRGLALRALLPDGKPIAEVTTTERWAALGSDGAWCVAHDTAVVVRIESSSGSGSYSAQAWLLP